MGWLIVAGPLGACGGSHAPAEGPPPATAAAPPVAVAIPPSEPPPAEATIAAGEAGQPAASSEFDVAPTSPQWNEQKVTAPVHTVTLGVKLAKRWSAHVGKTTFRTTMALAGDAIVIGTHGASLGGKNEASDGVYVLDAKTGKQRTLVRTPGTGDKDVGGIAVDGDRVFFGTDNGLVVAATLAGKALWTAHAQGKVRPAPSLADLDGDGDLDVVVGDEAGLLRAFDGTTGKPLWTAATGKNDYGAQGFIGGASLVDVDGDGHPDVIAGARDGILAAYRGTNGDVIWQIGGSSGIHATPLVADFDQDGKPEVLAAWSYGELVVADARSGTRRWNATVSEDGGGIEGLFGTPVPLPGAPGVIVAPTSWWGQKEDGIVGVGVDQREFKDFEGRVTASAVVTDIDGDGTREAILGTEAGKLVALHADGGYAVLATLTGGVEAPAMLADVDGDGAFELLVASNDGSLTCFSTGSRKTPDVPRFRGESAHNTGQLGAIKLGWHSASAAQARAGRGAASSGAGSRGNIRIDYLRCCSALQDAATRAPAPDNATLLRGAATCASMAAAGTDRQVALRAVSTALGGVALPAECR